MAPSDPTLADEAAGNGTGVDFLDNLAPLSGPSTASTATRNSSPPRTSGRSAGASAGRAKTKTDPTMFYIGGGIAAVVLVVVLVAVAMSGNRGSSSGGGKKKDENIRFGMTETQRRRLYKDLIHAVDDNGMSKATQKEWRSLGKEFKLTDQQVSAVLQEGLENTDWEQPDLAATMDQRQKTNRMEWIRKMNETKREPIMSM
jgi:hypothetical protein